MQKKCKSVLPNCPADPGMLTRSIVFNVMVASDSFATVLPESNFARNGALMNTETRPSIKYLSSKRGEIIFRKNGERYMFVRKTTSGRLFGLDASDWSVLALGVTLAGLLMVLGA
jgi:hypothetical protein